MGTARLASNTANFGLYIDVGSTVDVAEEVTGIPTEKSALKVVYLAIMDASNKWTMPIRNWKPALNRFTILFGERVTAYL